YDPSLHHLLELSPGRTSPPPMLQFFGRRSPSRRLFLLASPVSLGPHRFPCAGSCKIVRETFPRRSRSNDRPTPTLPQSQRDGPSNRSLGFHCSCSRGFLLLFSRRARSRNKAFTFCASLARRELVVTETSHQKALLSAGRQRRG